MKPYERLTFLRLMTGTDQTELADIAQISQRAIASIEKGEYGLRNNRSKLFSTFFNCREEWFSNGEPPAFEQWEYWEFPPKNIIYKTKSYRARYMRRQDKFIRSELDKFLVENRVTEYVSVKVKKMKNTLYLFELAGDGFLIINTNIMFDAIKEALKKISLNLKRKIIVSADILSVIGSPYDDNVDPEIIAGLFKKAGFIVKKKFAKNAARNRLVSSHSTFIKKITRMIADKGLSVDEVIASIQKMKK